MEEEEEKKSPVMTDYPEYYEAAGCTFEEVEDMVRDYDPDEFMRQYSQQ
jgi:hypothetical protein